MVNSNLKAAKGAQAQVKKPGKRRESAAQVKRLFAKSHSLFPQLADKGESLLATVTKVRAEKGKGTSKQGAFQGAVPRPFNFYGARELYKHNVHHARCIEAKRIASVGLGLEDKALVKKLNKLCDQSFQHLMLQVAEDFEQTGNGFIEVVRQEGEITGLHFMPSIWVSIINENDTGRDQHYEIHSDGVRAAHTLRFAKFGDKKDFHTRHPDAKEEFVSELIHFADPSSFSRWWGMPSWLAATAQIELAQAITQHQFDFHINRGVPEFMLFVMGTKVRKKDWTAIEESLQAQIGLGNSHKSLAINLGDPNITVQLEKLAMESAADGEYFRAMMETLSVNIVSAHGTPPSIAGIMIPGKMGASNEATNAIMSFQALTVGPRQEMYETVLGCTLGDDVDGVQGVNDESFDFKTIVNEMAEAMKLLQPMDTMGRMRDEMPEAAADGRDLEDGVKKMTWDQRVARHVLQKVLQLSDDPRGS